MKSHIQKHLTSYKEKYKNRGRLLISCPDKPGIVAAVSTFLHEHGANIVESSQHSTNHEGGMFFIRFEFECEDLLAKETKLEESFKKIDAKIIYLTEITHYKEKIHLEKL